MMKVKRACLLALLLALALLLGHLALVSMLQPYRPPRRHFPRAEHQAEHGATAGAADATVRLAVIVPVSTNRAADALELVRTLRRQSLPYHGLASSATHIYLAEQLNSPGSWREPASLRPDPWNKGRLLNAAFTEVQQLKRRPAASRESAGTGWWGQQQQQQQQQQQFDQQKRKQQHPPPPPPPPADVVIFHDADVWETCPGALDYAACARGGGGGGSAHAHDARARARATAARHLYGYPPGFFGSFPAHIHIMGGVFCVGAAVFEGVDGFANGFVGWGDEDVDFGFRLHAHGARVDVSSLALRHARCVQDTEHDGIPKTSCGGESAAVQTRANRSLVGQPSTSGLRDVRYRLAQRVELEPGVTVLRIELAPSPVGA
jgi:hypothetical protein